MVKWNWRKSRIIFPRVTEHLVVLCKSPALNCQQCNYRAALKQQHLIVLHIPANKGGQFAQLRA